MSHLCKIQDVVLKTIVSSDQIDMSWWIKAMLNKLCFERSILNEYFTTGSVRDSLLQSPNDQTTEALRLFRSELDVTVFQDFLGQSQKKFAEMKEDVKNEGTILSKAGAYAWITSVTHLLTDNRTRDGDHQKAFAKHHSKKCFGEIIQLLCTIRNFSNFGSQAGSTL